MAERAIRTRWWGRSASAEDRHGPGSARGGHGPALVTPRDAHGKATLTNTGSRVGDDVPQLYVHESDVPLLAPVKKLEGSQRVTLNAGQAKTVTFTLNSSNLGYYDNNGRFVLTPGPFDVYVGDSSMGGLHATFTLQ